MSTDGYNEDLDSKLLNIAISNYRFQSKTLNIPCLWGFFSSGNARLQIDETLVLAMFVFQMAIFLPSQ